MACESHRRRRGGRTGHVVALGLGLAAQNRRPLACYDVYLSAIRAEVHLEVSAIKAGHLQMHTPLITGGRRRRDDEGRAGVVLDAQADATLDRGVGDSDLQSRASEVKACQQPCNLG